MRTPIRELRQARDMTQAQLAELTGTTQVTVSGWETGRHVPSAKHLLKLSEALGVPMNDIAFGGEVRVAERDRVRELIAATAAEGSNPGIWRSDEHIFVRDHYAPADRLFVGLRRAFTDYCADAGELIVLPIGSHRRGTRPSPVWRFPSELPA